MYIGDIISGWEMEPAPPREYSRNLKGFFLTVNGKGRLPGGYEVDYGEYLAPFLKKLHQESKNGFNL